MVVFPSFTMIFARGALQIPVVRMQAFLLEFCNDMKRDFKLASKPNN